MAHMQWIRYIRDWAFGSPCLIRSNVAIRDDSSIVQLVLPKRGVIPRITARDTILVIEAAVVGWLYEIWRRIALGQFDLVVVLLAKVVDTLEAKEAA